MRSYLNSKIHGVVDKIHAGRSIDWWDPYQASPTNVKSSWKSNICSKERQVKHHKNKRYNKSTITTNLDHGQCPWYSNTQLPTRRILWHTQSLELYLLALNRQLFHIAHTVEIKIPKRKSFLSVSEKWIVNKTKMNITVYIFSSIR